MPIIRKLKREIKIGDTIEHKPDIWKKVFDIKEQVQGRNEYIVYRFEDNSVRRVFKKSINRISVKIN
jgi:hypothetical protein